MLPHKLYEAIRWTVAVGLPAASVLFSTLCEAWGWELPVEAILTTISAVALFLGSVFGISKIINDSKE